MQNKKRLSRDLTRRDLLLGMGITAASTLVGFMRTASADQFGTKVTWAGYQKFEASPQKAQAAMRARGVVTRKSISTLSEKSDELRMFKQAVGVMRARTERNPMHPNGWAATAAQHSLYCSGAVNGLQVHWSWFFLPWHRGYLYHLERALAAAIGEPTFALPYWDSSSDQLIPPSYWGEGNPLHDTTRLQRPQDRVPLDFMDVNACLMPKDFRTFGGYPYVTDEQEMVEGVMESMFHNNCHNWIGGNMATFWNAGYDPIFSGHHCNIDRAWSAWSSMPGHAMPTDKAWLDTVFTYADPQGQPVRMSIRDMLNTEAIGYRFDTLNFTQPKITPPTLNGKATGYAVTLDASQGKTIANALRTGRQYVTLQFTRVQANRLAVPLCARVFLGIDNQQADYVTTVTLLPVQNGGAANLNEHVTVQMALRPEFAKHVESGKPLVAYLDPVPLRGRQIPQGAIKLEGVTVKVIG